MFCVPVPPRYFMHENVLTTLINIKTVFAIRFKIYNLNLKKIEMCVQHLYTRH